MTATCFRCDWVGDTDGAACPRCGAPLYRPAPRDSGRRAAARSESGADPDSPAAGSGPAGSDQDRAASEGRPVATSARAVFAVVGTAFFVIAVLLSQGIPEREPRRVAPSPSSRGGPTGFLVYAVPDGAGSARLWRWDLVTDEVREGPLIPAPLQLVNVRSPSYGWLGVTSDVGEGSVEASVLDSVEVGAEVEALGRGTIVTWARQGETALLVQRGPLLDGCRRRVSVVAVHVDRPGVERVFDATICGDVLSVGRTTVGHFLTMRGRDGIHVVGAGYSDAGILLRHHGLIAVSPGGDMLVTPSADLVPADLAPRRGAGAGRDVPLAPVAGRVSFLAQFSGPPVPYLVDGARLRVDEVLSYGPGATTALVLGRAGDEPHGLWELPLDEPGNSSTAPRSVGAVDGFTAATYANDGTAYVVTGGRLWLLRNHRLTPLDVPDGAPTPAGPLAWVVQEPISDL